MPSIEGKETRWIPSIEGKCECLLREESYLVDVCHRGKVTEWMSSIERKVTEWKPSIEEKCGCLP